MVSTRTGEKMSAKISLPTGIARARTKIGLANLTPADLLQRWSSQANRSPVKCRSSETERR